MNCNWYKIVLFFQGIKFGKFLSLRGVPFIFKKKGSELVIGEKVKINSSFFSNLIGLYQKTIIMTRSPEAKIYIGNNVGISGSTIYARKKIVIGDGTIVGANSKILDNDFHPLNMESRAIDDKSKIKTGDIYIGKNCFIGCNTIILKGTILGNNCIVGAGAVVSGKFGDNCTIVGNPARKI